MAALKDFVSADFTSFIIPSIHSWHLCFSENKTLRVFNLRRASFWELIVTVTSIIASKTLRCQELRWCGTARTRKFESRKDLNLSWSHLELNLILHHETNSSWREFSFFRRFLPRQIFFLLHFNFWFLCHRRRFYRWCCGTARVICLLYLGF